MNTITESVTLDTQHCIQCDVIFALTRNFTNILKERGQTFYCPNGHSQCYTETDNMRLQKQLAQKQRELTESKCETMAERQRREAAESEMAKHQRRTKHGVCPCCRRTFVRLSNHIAKAHPDYGVKQKQNLS